MSLRVLAESDLEFILEDEVFGFGWPITVTPPLGAPTPLTGYSNDISQIIDPETGQAVSGRLASAVLRTSSLYSANLDLPQGIADSDSRPWLIQFDDINGLSYVFKVQKSNPDRALGVVSCILEPYDMDIPLLPEDSLFTFEDAEGWNL